MGAPQPPSSAQYAELERAGQLALLGDPQVAPIQAGSLSLTFELPRQAVSLLVVDLAR
jgi:xylan 1,4-beta-xylosidase